LELLKADCCRRVDQSDEECGQRARQGRRHQAEPHAAGAVKGQLGDRPEIALSFDVARHDACINIGTGAQEQISNRLQKRKR